MSRYTVNSCTNAAGVVVWSVKQGDDLIADVSDPQDAQRVVDLLNGTALGLREVATVLAALRYWQQGKGGDDTFDDVATDGGTLAPLSDDEIDATCERLNVARGA